MRFNVRRTLFILISFLIASCAGKSHLQRVVHQTSDSLVVLDKGELSVSPAFPPPYQHPQDLSPESLQRTLESVRVLPSSGFLNNLFSGKDKDRPLFDADTAEILSLQLSKALAKADPSERVTFYHALPASPSEVFVTSGFLLFQGDRLHLRVKDYRIPLRNGSPLTSVGNTLPPSEMSKYRFELSENKQMLHRRFQNVFGLEGTDAHWLVVDVHAPPDPPATSGETSMGIVEKLRTLKRLKDEGLIDEEDYIEKKRTLLDGF